MALTDNQLTRLDETREVHIRTRSGDRTVETIIWIIVANGTVYVRSVRGEGGRWYKRALANPEVDIVLDGTEIPFGAVHVDDTDEIEAVSNALRDKYPPGGSLDRMTADTVLDTTLRLEPTA